MRSINSFFVLVDISSSGADKLWWITDLINYDLALGEFQGNLWPVNSNLGSGPCHKPPRPPNRPLNLEIRHKSLLAHRSGPPVFIFQFRGLGTDLIQGWDAGSDKNITPDGRPSSDNGLPTEYRRPGIDCHIVFDGWMAFLAAQELAETGGQRAQGHALVDLDVVADLGGLADDHTGAVVDEQAMAELCPGVDVDA